MNPSYLCVRFDITCSGEEYTSLCDHHAEAIAEVDGLLSKRWWLDRQAGRAGGDYVFSSRESAEAYLEGPLVRSLRRAPTVRNFEFRLSELLESLCERTRGGIARETADGDRRQAPPADPAQPVHRFAQRVLDDYASAVGGVMVSLGHSLGLYAALAARGPSTSAELARAADVHERYAREWLHQQRAAGYLEYQPAEGRFWLSEAAKPVLADSESPVFMPPAFDAAAAMWANEPRLAQVFRSGEGMAWGEQHHRLFCGTESFFRNAYRAHLTSEWIPALDEEARDRLRRGARVADIGCGHGASTILMARSYPESSFWGFDNHAPSIEVARQRAEEAAVAERVHFECASATQYGGGPFDLIFFFDAFHDMGSAVQAARHAEARLAEGGAVVLVEPRASDRPQENVGSVAAMFYAASTALCTPNALCDPTGVALGAQAGPEQLRRTLEQGGLTRVRIAIETPFHTVLEARP